MPKPSKLMLALLTLAAIAAGGPASAADYKYWYFDADFGHQPGDLTNGNAAIAAPAWACARRFFDGAELATTASASRRTMAAGALHQLQYFCPVFNPDFTAMQPSWRHLRLTYADNSGVKGNISVRLFAKSRAKLAIDPPLGATFKVAQVLSLPAPTVNVVSVALPGTLDFHRYSYWLVLGVGSPTFATAAQVDVHEIQLTD